MRRFRARTIPAIVAAVMFAGQQLIGPSQGHAAAADQIYFNRVTSPGGSLVMTADGTGRRADPCPGDRTHGGGSRQVLRIEPTGGAFAAHVESDTTISQPITQVFARDEACTSAVRLTDLPSGYRLVSATWSLDDRRVAIGMLRYGATSQLVEQGVLVGELDPACSGSYCPLQNLHLALSLPMVPVANQNTNDGLTAFYEHSTTASWSPDGRRIAFQRRVDPSTSQLVGIFVADIGPAGSSTPATASRFVVTNGAAQQTDPAFSPVAGDDRIAFVQITSTKSCTRSDIYVAASGGGVATQVTTSKTANVCQLARPEWSPDGSSFAFDAAPLSLSGTGIYRVAADGRSKAVALALDSGVMYVAPKWRP